MEVAEERDGEAIQPAGPAPQGNLFANQSGAVGLDQRRVGGNRRYSNSCCPFDELATVDQRKRPNLRAFPA
jgi:hypothetical protein